MQIEEMKAQVLDAGYQWLARSSGPDELKPGRYFVNLTKYEYVNGVTQPNNFTFRAWGANEQEAWDEAFAQWREYV